MACELCNLSESNQPNTYHKLLSPQTNLKSINGIKTPPRTPPRNQFDFSTFTSKMCQKKRKRRRPSVTISYIEKVFVLPKLLGLFNFYYEEKTHKFVQSTLLSCYNRVVLVTIYIAAVCGFIAAFLLLIPRIWHWKDSVIIQDRLIWFVNFLQLYFGVLLTYTNHSTNQLLLPGLLNSILRSNRRLVGLVGKDVRPAKCYYFASKLRLSATAADICITLNRPIFFFLITHEWAPFVVANKIVLTASFMGWHLVQAILSTVFDTINDWVEQSNGTLSAKDYQVLSKICSQLRKAKHASNAYYAQFLFISCMNLIKTVALYYSCFVTLFLSGVGRVSLLTLILNYTLWMLGPGLVLVVDLVLLGMAAENVSAAAKRFHNSVIVEECKRVVPEVSQKIIGVVMRQAHLEDLQTTMKLGLPMDRSVVFDWLRETITWVIVFFMYNGGQRPSALIAVPGMHLSNQSLYIFAIMALIVFCVVLFIVYWSIVCLWRCICRRVNAK